MANEIRLQSFNAKVKVSGQTVTIKRFDRQQLKGYMKKTVTGTLTEKTEAEREIERRERFLKTNRRAKTTIFDLIACNVSKEDKKDYNGRNQKIKFMTLTFEADLDDLKQANKMFTAFMKRLSYFHFGTKKNVIKYLAVPELQERGVWHFHVVLFNCPYVSNKKDSNGVRALESLWGHGFVFINAIQRKTKNGKMADVDGHFVAGYITKYMTKEIEYVEETREMRLKKGEGDKAKVKELYDYDNYDNLNLWGMKRYQASKGLKKPVEGVLRMNKDQFKQVLAALKTAKHSKCKEFKQLFETKIKTQDGQVIESKMWINSFTVKQNSLIGLKEYVKTLSKTSYCIKELASIGNRRKKQVTEQEYLELQFLEWYNMIYKDDLEMGRGVA